jgi:nitrogen fixation NifU-like protein
LIESILGKNIEEIKVIDKDAVLENLGIELGPVRLKCALLPLKVLKAGIYGIGDQEIEE